MTQTPSKKQIFLTIFITLIVLGIMVGGIIVLGIKTVGQGKSGRCEWQPANEVYKDIVCEGFVEKNQIVTAKLKNADSKEIILESAVGRKCSNTNNIFMCVGLLSPCQVLSQRGPEFTAKCPIPWGPMYTEMHFNIGTAKITWER